MEFLANRLVPTQCLQFLNERPWKIRPKSPEITLPRSAQKQTWSRLFAVRLVNKQKAPVSIVGKQHRDVNGHQIIVREHVFSSLIHGTMTHTLFPLMIMLTCDKREGTTKSPLRERARARNKRRLLVRYESANT